MSSLSNAELDALVMADITAAAADPVSATPPVAGEEIRVEPLVETPTPAAAPAATPAAPAPEAKVEEPVSAQEDVIEWRGQQVRVDPAQRKELLQKGFDYTQKTMEVAGLRRAAEEEVRSVRQAALEQQAAVQNLFNDPEKLEAIAAAARARLGLAPSAQPMASATPNDPDDFVSKAELTRRIDEVMRSAKAEVEKAKTGVREDIELTQMTSAYKSDFDRTLDTLVKDKFPLLTEFGGEDVADKIRRDASAFHQSFMILNPGVQIQPEQVKAVMLESAKRRSDQIEGRLREREKNSAIKQTKLTTQGIEPKGGQAPPQAASAKPMKLNDPSLDAQVLQEIQSIMGRG